MTLTYSCCDKFKLVIEEGLGDRGIYFFRNAHSPVQPVNNECTLDYPDVCTTHKKSLKVDQNLTGVLQFVHIVCFSWINFSSLI